MGSFYIGAALAWGLLAIPAQAAVSIDTVQSTVGALEGAPHDHHVDAQILAGEWDDVDLVFPVKPPLQLSEVQKKYGDFLYRDEGIFALRVHSKTFMSLPERARTQVRDHIEHWEDAMVAYQTSIDVRANRDELKKSFVIQELNVDLDRLNARVPAQELLSRYAQDYVYKFMENSGPNCIYSAIASIFEGFEPPRYMDIPEFLQDMTDYFQPIDKPDQWGDIVRFVIPGDIHAFTFLGRDAKDPGVPIVLTKNGYSPSHLTVMNYDEVYQLYAEYGIQAVEYYRPVKIAKPHPTLRPEGAMKGINPLPRAYLRAVPLAKRPVLEL